jgi:hypothetical protein
MSKKRAGTRKIKGGSRPPTISRPAKFSFGGFVNSIQSHVDDTLHAATPSVSLARNVNIHDLNVKKAQRGGSKTQKGGMDLSGLLEGAHINIDNLNVEKKRHAGGMSCGTKKHGKKSKKGGMSCGSKKSKKGGKKSKKGGEGPKEWTRAWAASLSPSIQRLGDPGQVLMGGTKKKSMKGGIHDKYFLSTVQPSTSRSGSWQSHFPGGFKNYVPVNN